MYLIHKSGEAHEGVATRATRAVTSGPTRTRVTKTKTTGAAEQERVNEQKETQAGTQAQVCACANQAHLCECKQAQMSGDEHEQASGGMGTSESRDMDV